MSGAVNGFQFWSAKVNPTKPTVVNVNGDEWLIHVSGACLGADAKKGRSVVSLETENGEGPICSLTYGSQEHAHLDLPISGPSKVVFKVSGENQIHLSGYLQPLEDESVVPAAGASVEESELSKKSISNGAKVSPSKKRKAAGTPVSPPPKKQRKEVTEENPAAEEPAMAPTKKPVKEPAKEDKPAKKAPDTPPSSQKSSEPESPDSSATSPNKKKKKKDKKKKWQDRDEGVKVREIKSGKGKGAKVGTTVTVKYVGTLDQSGAVFDQNLNEGLTFTIGKDVVSGFSIGMVGIKVGGKRRIKVPPAAGYGSKGMEKIPANSTLVFTVQRTE